MLLLVVVLVLDAKRVILADVVLHRIAFFDIRVTSNRKGVPTNLDVESRM